MYKRIGGERLGISRSSGSNASKPNPSTMKMMIVVALAFVAAVTAAPAAPSSAVAEVEPPKILRSDFVQQPDGTYNFAFETENGINRGETGEIKEVLDEENKPHTVVIVRGSYTYTDKDGKVETVNYYADESGFHAEGDSIPKPQQPARR